MPLLRRLRLVASTLTACASMVRTTVRPQRTRRHYLRLLRTALEFVLGPFTAVRVDCRENGGAPSVIRTTLRTTGPRRRRAVIKPSSVDMYIEAGQSYSVFFGVRPRRARGKTTLNACTRAIPSDVNP